MPIWNGCLFIESYRLYAILRVSRASCASGFQAWPTDGARSIIALLLVHHPTITLQVAAGTNSKADVARRKKSAATTGPSQGVLASPLKINFGAKTFEAAYHMVRKASDYCCSVRQKVRSYEKQSDMAKEKSDMMSLTILRWRMERSLQHR